MKALLISALALSSCCGPELSKTACYARWGAGAVAIGTVGWIVYDKESEKAESTNLPQPEWEMDGRWQGALVSPTRTIYSTHIFSRRPNTVTYDGIAYKVTGYRKLEDPRAFTDIGTDITVVDHAPVPITPVKIASSVKEGDRVIAYLRNKVLDVKVVGVGKSIGVRADATYGDSSSSVANKDGELITLLSKAGGVGPNLTRIRDLILE